MTFKSAELDERMAKLRAEVRAEAQRAWRARGCPPPPRKPDFCADCIEATPRLVVGLSIHGRKVWLCPDCRSLGAQLRNMRPVEPVE